MKYQEIRPQHVVVHTDKAKSQLAGGKATDSYRQSLVTERPGKTERRWTFSFGHRMIGGTQFFLVMTTRCRPMHVHCEKGDSERLIVRNIYADSQWESTRLGTCGSSRRQSQL